MPCSEARESSATVVVPRCGLHRRQEAGRQDLLLPVRVRPGGGQAPDRLPALPRFRRGDRGAALKGGTRRAQPHPPPRLRRCRCGVGDAFEAASRRDRRRGGRRPTQRRQGVGRDLHLPRHVELGRRSVLEACLLEVVGHDRSGPVAAPLTWRARSPALLGGDGRAQRGPAERDRAPHRHRDGRDLLDRPVGSRARHDGLCHLDRLGQ